MNDQRDDDKYQDHRNAGDPPALFCKGWKGHWDVHDAETGSGKPVKDITLREYSDEVVLCFDERGRLYA